MTEGSRTAKGVLRVVNEVSLEALHTRAPDGAGLAARVVNNIADFRLGDDGLAGTADDGRFDTLAELDAIPFVGPIAFKKLVTYAEANGFVPHGTIVAGTSDVPTALVAYREGLEGPWQPATIKSPTSFEIEVDAAYIVAVVCEDTATGSFTTIEVGQMADEGAVAAFCGASLQAGAHALTGHVAQAGRVIAGVSSQFSSTASWDFSLPVDDGTYDLVATATGGITVRRGIVVAGDTAVSQPIDVNAETLPLVAVPITITNALATESVTSRVSLRPQTNTLSATVYTGAVAGAKVVLPSSLLATDRQRASVTASEGNFGRSLFRTVTESASTSITLPERLPTPLWTVEGGELQVRFAGVPAGDYFYVDASASSADGTKFWYHDLEASKRFVTESGLTHATLDTNIPGYKPEWKIDFAAEYSRDIFAYTFGTADTSTSSYSEFLNAPTARVAKPVRMPKSLARRVD